MCDDLPAGANQWSESANQERSTGGVEYGRVTEIEKKVKNMEEKKLVGVDCEIGRLAVNTTKVYIHCWR